MILLIVVFAVLMIIGAPVGLSLLGSSVAYLATSGYSLQQAFQAFTSAISNSFTLIAVPFFILAASIMNSGGITKKIFDFCNVVVGWVPVDWVMPIFFPPSYSPVCPVRPLLTQAGWAQLN